MNHTISRAAVYISFGTLAGQVIAILRGPILLRIDLCTIIHINMGPKKIIGMVRIRHMRYSLAEPTLLITRVMAGCGVVEYLATYPNVPEVFRLACVSKASSASQSTF